MDNITSISEGLEATIYVCTGALRALTITSRNALLRTRGRVQNAWERSCGWRKATELLLRDSEGSTASLYGLRGLVLG